MWMKEPHLYIGRDVQVEAIVVLPEETRLISESISMGVKIYVIA